MKRFAILFFAPIMVAVLSCGSGGSEGEQKDATTLNDPKCAELYAGKKAELPVGDYAGRLIGTPEGKQWRCSHADGEGGFEFKIERIEGTITGTFTGSWSGTPKFFGPLLDLHLGKDTLSEAAFPPLEQYPTITWNACKVGTQPPAYRGTWIWEATDDLCLRFDIFPFGVLCFRHQKNTGFSDTNFYTDVIAITADGARNDNTGYNLSCWTNNN